MTKRTELSPKREKQRKTTTRSGWGRPQPLSYTKRAKDGKKYVDYRKKFKYSVSDGSILAYYNGVDYTFTWEQGRQLASVTKGSKTASKIVNGVSYEYTTLSGKTVYSAVHASDCCWHC